MAGSLQLDATSTIALGTSTHTLTFNGITGTPGGILHITGWVGGTEFGSSAEGRLLFYLPGSEDVAAANAGYESFLSSVQFSGFALGDAMFISTGQTAVYEMTPTPEPGSILALAAGILGVGGYIRRRRRARFALSV